MTKQVQIKLTNGKVCILNKWGVLKCAREIPFFLETFGVPLSLLYSSGEDSADETLPEALNILAQKLIQSGGADIAIQKILENVLYQPSTGGSPLPLNIDEHLDDLDIVLELCAKCMKENYGSLGKSSIENLMSIFTTTKSMQG